MSGKAHLFVVLITVFAIGFIVRLVRRRQLRAKYCVLWLSCGGVVLLLAALPGLLDQISDWLGVSYQPGTFFISAIAFLFVLGVHFSWELSRLEERIRVLAEELAIRDAKPPLEADAAGTGQGGVS